MFYVWCAVLDSIVSTYLVHHGYCAAADAFLRSTGQSCEEELASIQNRQSMIFTDEYVCYSRTKLYLLTVGYMFFTLVSLCCICCGSLTLYSAWNFLHTLQ